MAPMVSVILPAYNAEDFVAEAVESVRTQDFRDYELIAVDDGSTDRTGDILDSLAAGFPAMRVIHQSNRGLAAARNAAIEQMAGSWIALLDADDLWLPQKLSRCMAYLREHPDLSIVYHPMDPVDRDGRAMSGHNKPCHEGWLTEKLFQSIFIHDPTVVFHRRVFDQCGGFDESLPVSVGNEYWLRVSTDFAFGLIDEPLALRRWTQTSLTRSNRLRGRLMKRKVLERFYFEQGGRDRLPKRPAMRRLAKISYHVGKSLLEDGRAGEAADAFRAALRYRPGYVKVWLYWLAARLRARSR